MTERVLHLRPRRDVGERVDEHLLAAFEIGDRHLLVDVVVIVAAVGQAVALANRSVSMPLNTGS